MKNMQALLLIMSLLSLNIYACEDQVVVDDEYEHTIDILEYKSDKQIKRKTIRFLGYSAGISLLSLAAGASVWMVMEGTTNIKLANNTYIITNERAPVNVQQLRDKFSSLKDKNHSNN